MAPPFLSRPLATLRGFTLWLALACAPLFAQVEPGAEAHYVVDVELQTIDELRQLLDRTDQLLVEGKLPSDDEPAVVFVLHGPVLHNMLRGNYLENKATVDRAASLSALGVVDIKACRAWLTGNNVKERDLQPFVQTVSYGPAEIERLMRERNYVYF